MPRSHFFFTSPPRIHLFCSFAIFISTNNHTWELCIPAVYHPEARHMFFTCKNYSSAATLGNSWQIIHFPLVDHFKKCASFSGHQSLWQLVFIWKNELNHQYTNSNFISPPLLMHRRKINAHASLWPALGCFFLNQWHPTCCQRRIMPALCGNGETVINFKVPQWLEFFQALRACISGISANTGYLGNRRLRQKKNEIYRFLIRFFLFFKTQLEGEEAAEADKDA